MMHNRFLVLLMVVVSLVVAVPAFAVAPAGGVVLEGVSVPGVELGSTRPQVQDAYDRPNSCQSAEIGGDLALCACPVDGGGNVWVRYRGAGGGNASNAPDDVASRTSWEERVSGWTTTAGVNTALARATPDAVLAAYPNGLVKDNMLGSIVQVKDYELGIQVDWSYDFYQGTASVSMAISAPSAPPPPPEPLTRVDRIELLTRKAKGVRQIRALVHVEDDRALAAPEATVYATWWLPGGTRVQVEDATSSSGYAYFEILDAVKGTYTLTIDDAILVDHRFDRANSVLSGSAQIK